jgi:hypothetical protein
MHHRYTALLCIAFASLAACDREPPSVEPATSPATRGIQTEVTELDAATLPAEVLSIVTNAVPGINIEGAERKEREGRVYYDVEGTRADGSEVELDLLEENGAYKVVEIQRDIPWAEAPEPARTAAAGAERPFEPVRVIESTQTDGSVIYELFAEGAPEKPALEVKMANGKAEVLKEEWPH